MQERMDLFDIEKAKVFFCTLHAEVGIQYIIKKGPLQLCNIIAFLLCVCTPSNYVLNIMNCNENQF